MLSLHNFIHHLGEMKNKKKEFCLLSRKKVMTSNANETDSTAPIKLGVSPEKFSLVHGINEDTLILLTNYSYQPVLFRMSTTAPKKFSVKQRFGVIQPGSQTAVSISLNRKEAQTSGIDAFCVEYRGQRPSDQIDANNGNVSDLIKATKKEEKGRRVISCTVSVPDTASVVKATTVVFNSAVYAPSDISKSASDALLSPLDRKSGSTAAVPPAAVDAPSTTKEATSPTTAVAQQHSSYLKPALVLLLAVFVVFFFRR